jgi:hypothetical protein
MIQYPGQTVGFGGIPGEPNDSAHTSANPLTFTSSGLTTAPTADVQCGGSERNSTTPEAVGSTQLGGTPADDASCAVGNTGVKTLSVTALAVSGCGFSLVSPPATPISLVTGTSYYKPITLAFAPCGVGTQTGALTVTSNDPSSPYTVPLTGAATGTIALATGWNLISLPASPTSTDPGTLLGGIMSSVSIVWGYSNGQWSCYPAQQGITPLTKMTTGNGYWIQMSAPATLTIN